MGKVWRADEIPIVDPLSWVRANPECVFAAGAPNDYDLRAAVMFDATARGGRCTVGSWRDFWIVSSDTDWLVHEELGVRELFSRIVAAPNHGANAMRAEVLLGAFCEDVATFDGGSWIDVSGTIPTDLRRAVEANPDSGRTVVFRLASGHA